jgi:hypothetical protein
MDGYYPRLLVYREALETVDTTEPLNDILNVLENRLTRTPQNLMFTFPYDGQNPGSIVFEYDGNITIDNGVTVRAASTEDLYQICTNHCRLRKDPIDCWRYNLINDELINIHQSNGTEYLTKEKSWEILDAVALNNITHHRVLFEPNKKRMHVALSVQTSSPQYEAVEIDIVELLSVN